MTTNIYQELTQYREVGGDMPERIRQLEVYDIFGPLVELFPEPIEFNGVLFFVLEVYSVVSPSVVLEGDWQQFKQQQFKRFRILPKYELDIVALASPVIRDCIRAYIDFQEQPVWRHYCVLQDLYLQFLGMALDVTAAVEEKHKAAKYAKEIMVELDEFRDKLRQEFGLIRRDEGKLPKKKQTRSLTLNVEDYVNAKEAAESED